jgi:hypothetical protein
MGQAPLMLRLIPRPSSLAAGRVTFVVTNHGSLNHEFLVLPMPADGVGTRPVGPNGKIDETQSLGEASTSRGAGPGNGISTGWRSWVTLNLRPGRYELLWDVSGITRTGCTPPFPSPKVTGDSGRSGDRLGGPLDSAAALDNR